MPLEALLDLFSDAFDSRQFLMGPKEEMPTGIIWEAPEGQEKDVGIILLREYYRSIAPRTQPIEVELEIEREFPDFILKGRLDFIEKEGSVGDWKTARKNKNRAEVENDIQPTVYATLLDSPIDFQFHMMIKSRMPYTHIWKCSRTQNEILWLIEHLIPPIVKLIEAGLFPMTDPSVWYCSKRYCECWDYCRGRKQFVVSGAQDGK